MTTKQAVSKHLRAHRDLAAVDVLIDAAKNWQEWDVAVHQRNQAYERLFATIKQLDAANRAEGWVMTETETRVHYSLIDKLVQTLHIRARAKQDQKASTAESLKLPVYAPEESRRICKELARAEKLECEATRQIDNLIAEIEERAPGRST